MRSEGATASGHATPERFQTFGDLAVSGSGSYQEDKNTTRMGMYNQEVYGAYICIYIYNIHDYICIYNGIRSQLGYLGYDLWTENGR